MSKKAYWEGYAIGGKQKSGWFEIPQDPKGTVNMIQNHGFADTVLQELVRRVVGRSVGNMCRVRLTLELVCRGRDIPTGHGGDPPQGVSDE